MKFIFFSAILINLASAQFKWIQTVPNDKAMRPPLCAAYDKTIIYGGYATKNVSLEGFISSIDVNTGSSLVNSTFSLSTWDDLRSLVGTKDGALIAGSTKATQCYGKQVNSSGNANGFIGKFSQDVYAAGSAGDVSWSTLISSNGSNAGDVKVTAVAESSDGCISAIAEVQGSVNGLQAAGSYDLFLVRYDTNGYISWSYEVGSQSSESSGGVLIDGEGNTYYSGMTSLGFSFQNQKIPSGFFVLKISSDGTLKWIYTWAPEYFYNVAKMISTPSGDIAILYNFDQARRMNQKFGIAVINKDGSLVHEAAYSTDYYVIATDFVGLKGSSDSTRYWVVFEARNEAFVVEVSLDTKSVCSVFTVQGADTSGSLCAINDNELLVTGFANSTSFYGLLEVARNATCDLGTVQNVTYPKSSPSVSNVPTTKTICTTSVSVAPSQSVTLISSPAAMPSLTVASKPTQGMSGYATVTLSPASWKNSYLEANSGDLKLATNLILFFASFVLAAVLLL